MDEILKLEQIEYGYFKNGREIRVIRDACGSFRRGTVYAVIGRSRREKAVLLSLTAGLEQPCAGRILFDGADINAFDRDDWRKRNVGLALQAYQPVPYLTALENAALQAEILGWPAAARKKAAGELLDQLGFDSLKYNRKASRLNPSEQRKVALARAAGFKPRLLLIEADGWDDDPESESRLVNVLTDTARRDGACVIIASDSRSLAGRADEVWGMKDGVLLPLKTL